MSFPTDIMIRRTMYIVKITLDTFSKPHFTSLFLLDLNERIRVRTINVKNASAKYKKSWTQFEYISVKLELGNLRITKLAVSDLCGFTISLFLKTKFTFWRLKRTYVSQYYTCCYIPTVISNTESIKVTYSMKDNNQHHGIQCNIIISSCFCNHWILEVINNKMFWESYLQVAT